MPMWLIVSRHPTLFSEAKQTCELGVIRLRGSPKWLGPELNWVHHVLFLTLYTEHCP